ncbi:MAG: helix-turn-helix domain-containing protein [Mangrovibacterium sp.]
MHINKDHFDIWMERIHEKLEKLDRRLGKQPLNIFEGERLLDNQDLCLMLHISKRTLQRYRSSGRLKYQCINKKLYYKESDVHRFIRGEFEGGKVGLLSQR